MSKLTLSVPEVAALIGISRTSAYEAVRRGEIPSLVFGRRIVVPRSALEELLGPLPAMGSAPSTAGAVSAASTTAPISSSVLPVFRRFPS
jgi:excisionase family DNA binding protein